MGENYKLTYFNVKAVGEPIRLIFAYAGVKYEDNRVEHADWPEMKSIGDKTLGQSNAICRYLGKKFNLDGDNDWENAKIDEFADAVADFRMAWARTFKEKDETRKAELLKDVLETVVPQVFGTLEATIVGNGGSPYLVGKKLTWIDLLTAHYLDFFENLHPGVLIKYPNLIKLKTVVYQTEQIKEWCEKRPVTNM
ncbi:Glutathione S-transferase [Orchesella cincta]|uniref:glutathione transferase n=1 Tax=Orchesella cincta TaxID=48709 RepID=A0A1D2MBV3_ORCCI|nr:Glutathione S-transferase [Orchesella cincta]